MPFLSVPDTVEVVINGDISGQPIANVVGAGHVGAYVQADLDNLAAAVDGWVASDYLPLVSASVNYVSTHVRGLTNIIDLESTDTTSAGPGTASGGGMPANASFVVTLRTGHTGRSARGRFYMWPYSTSALLTSQTVTTTYSNAAQAALIALSGVIATAGFQMVIISRRSNNVPRLVGVTTPVTDIESRNQAVDSMRHRLLRGH
jgi:hypothetical protein